MKIKKQLQFLHHYMNNTKTNCKMKIYQSLAQSMNNMTNCKKKLKIDPDVLIIHENSKFTNHSGSFSIKDSEGLL